MKITIKWIGVEWIAFLHDGNQLRSTGINDIVEQVEEYYRPLIESGTHVKWEAKEGKLVGAIQSLPQGKLSKKNQGANR